MQKGSKSLKGGRRKVLEPLGVPFSGVWNSGYFLPYESPATAYAVVANTVACRILANFYVGLRRPKRPYRVFSSRERAVRWLLTQTKD